MTDQGHTPTGSDAFDYDVFISYRRVDPSKTWVWQKLVPALESCGIKICIDDRDFRMGYELLNEMERAVIKSRYTLAVMTPAFMLSSWIELERIMAQHLGLERQEHRLLAVMREPCDPPLLMRISLWLDMTDDSRFDLAMSRLRDTLRRDPDS